MINTYCYDCARIYSCQQPCTRTTEISLDKQLEQYGRRLRRLITVPAHVAAESLPRLEPLAADVAPVLRLLIRTLGFDGVALTAGGEGELEPVAAAEVAGPVTAERLERREGAAARLAHELVPTGGRGAAHLLVDVGYDAEGEREGE